MKSNLVTCSFVMDRDVYNTFKSIITRHGQNVKESLLGYMQSVTKYDIPNADTILAIHEVEALKNDPDKKIYNSFSNCWKMLEKTMMSNDTFKYRIVSTSLFKKDIKLAKKRGYNLSLLDNVANTIAKGLPSPEKFKDHMQEGNSKGCRECHITSDRLLICEISEKDLILYLAGTETHSDLFS